MATNALNQYPNLPGVLAEFKDGGLVLRNDPNPPQTESILILGTAIDGPVLQPIAVDASTVEAVFGRGVNPNGTSNRSTLVKAFEQAYNAGCRDIRLVRISGTEATGTVQTAAISTDQDKVVIPQPLGQASGNDEVTFTLNQFVIDEGSVDVVAGGVSVPVSKFTPLNGDEVTETYATVTLDANAVTAGSSVYINYNFTNSDGDQESTRDESFDGDAYVASGSAKEYTLAHTPKLGSVQLYASGVLVNTASYSIDTTGASPKLVLNAGATAVGAPLEVSYIYTETASENAEINFKSTFAGSIYNETKVEVKNITNSSGSVIGKKLIITKPASKLLSVGETAMEYSSLDYPSLGLMASAINRTTINNVVVAEVSDASLQIESSQLQVKAQTALTGGTDGTQLTKEQVYDKMQEAYYLLEDVSVDMIVPAGVYANDMLVGKYRNFAYQLALACAVISHRNKATIGVIGMKPAEDTSLQKIKDNVSSMLAYNMNFFMRDSSGSELTDTDGNKIDLGRYISVVAGPEVILGSNRFGVYSDTPATVYAGMLSTLKAQSAPTNKVVPGVLGLRYSLSNAQLDQLVGSRFVTLKTKNNGANVAIVDGMTAAQATSDYRRVSTVRIVKEVIDQIREVADPYIGEPNEVSQRNALSASISKRLGVLKEQGAIVDFEFQIIATPQMQLVGQASIELTLVPALELRQITTVISLRPSL